MKTALISGGTSGIGLSIGKALLESGEYEVLLIGRDAAKGEAASAPLAAVYPERVEFLQLDLSDIKGVMTFADQFVESRGRLDLLVNVAGVMVPTRKITNEGFERTFAVGYLSAFVLSTRLASLLEKAPNGRIANVAGVRKFVFNAKLDFDDLSFSQNYGGFKAGITTIHAKTVLTQILSERYASRGIDVNSFHPGAVRSDLMKNMSWWIRPLFKLMSLFMSTNSKTGIYVCSSPDLDGTTGKYIVGKKTIELEFERAYMERLWKESEEMLGPLSVSSAPPLRVAT